MSTRLDDAGRDLLFREARSHSFWLDRPVNDAVLHEMYDLLKWCPTSANTCPMRVLFLRSRESKERLRPALAPSNVDKTMSAPVTAIIAHDYTFAERLPQLFPHNPGMREVFRAPPIVEVTARRNGTLQAAYLIMAARAVGLDCGPMSGFDPAKVDAEFFPSGQQVFPGADVRTDMLCNLGFGDRARLFPRNPRFSFEEACAVL